MGKALPAGGTIGIASPASPYNRYSDVLRTHLGKVMRYDNREVRQRLRIEFIPVEQTIVETADDLIRWGHLGPRDGRLRTVDDGGVAHQEFPYCRRGRESRVGHVDP
jgi:hypothetical protein